MKALVIRNTGSWYQVKLENGDLRDVRIKGRFRLLEIRSTSPVVVGDNVEVEGESIVHIYDRKNYVVRKSSNLSKQSHILAANVDQVLLLVTINYPKTPIEFIDRFLVTTEAYRIPTVLVFNKTDLYDDADKRQLVEWKALYESLSYKCIETSSLTKQGVSEVEGMLSKRISLLSGNSGVGKSTLINLIDANLNLRTAEISSTHQTGMHTTTFSEMFPIAGGYIIDTPGIKGFGTVGMERAEIGDYFPEILKFSEDCRFNNCSHREEPNCAVLEAVKKGDIALSRYSSYLSICDDAEEGKYR